MLSYRLGIQLAALCAVLLLSLTACFRDTSEAIEQQPVARQVASPTPVPQIEPTDMPPTEALEPLATDEPAATEAVVDEFALSATALIARLTEPAIDDQPSATGDAMGTALPRVSETQIPLIRSTIPPGEDCVHEIRAGDTLFQLSLAYGVTVDQIAAASAIDNPDRIAVGQRIVIPECGTTGFIPPPTSLPPPTVDLSLIPATSEAPELELADAGDDTRYALIEQAQATLLDNATANEPSVVSAQLAAADMPSTQYTVQQNDTLFEIAARFGTTVEVLAALNNIADVDSLGAGDVLQIP